MNFLKKQHSVILFLVAMSVTFNVITLSWVVRLNTKIENFEPVVIEQVEPIIIERTVADVAVEQVEPVVTLDCPLDEVTQHMIQQKCAEYDVDYSLVMAIIFKESSFRPNLISSTNDYGLMQINKVNHKWLSEELGITDFLNPEENVTAGIYMLDQLSDKYEDRSKVLMAYNMGETGAKRLWAQGIYSTDYSEGVLQVADKYAKEMMGDV